MRVLVLGSCRILLSSLLPQLSDNVSVTWQECLWARQLSLLTTPYAIGWELCLFHLVALARPHHPSTHRLIHTHSGTGCPGVRQQTLFNLFSSALIGSKLPSLPSWCANECGIEGRPPITPQAHLQDTSGCRAAVCDLYMADEGGAGGVRLSVPTWIRETGAEEKIPELIIVVEA